MKILAIDMDNVLVDFQSGIDQLSSETLGGYEGRLDEIPGIFSLMQPLDGAIEAFTLLCETFDVHIVSTAPWYNPSAWSDKIVWVQEHLGKEAFKRLTLTHHKNLFRGDIIIDDRVANGVSKFSGDHIHFGTPQFPDWESVLNHLLPMRYS